MCFWSFFHKTISVQWCNSKNSQITTIGIYVWWIYVSNILERVAYSRVKNKKNNYFLIKKRPSKSSEITVCACCTQRMKKKQNSLLLRFDTTRPLRFNPWFYVTLILCPCGHLLAILRRTERKSNVLVLKRMPVKCGLLASTSSPTTAQRRPYNAVVWVTRVQPTKSVQRRRQNLNIGHCKMGGQKAHWTISNGINENPLGIFRKPTGKNTSAKCAAVMENRDNICINIRMTSEMWFFAIKGEIARGMCIILKKKKRKAWN